MKKTNELLNAINTSDNIDGFLSDNKDEFVTLSISEHLCNIIEERNLIKSDVIRKSNLDRVYAYQILSGIRIPSRDKLIQFAFGLGLNLNECQTLLKYGGYAPLMPKNRRDSIIIYGINKTLSIIDLNILLDNKQEKIVE